MNRRFEIQQEGRPAGSDAYKVRGETEGEGNRGDERKKD